MEATRNETPIIKVVMFPWLGYGHITPYLELAKKLTTRNFKIYLCSTIATLSCIEEKITPKLSHSIKLVPLLLPVLPGLPRKLHTTNGLPPHLMPKLKEALDSSVDEFSNILGDIKPDLLIYDFLQPWAPLVANEQNIPAVQFITSSSTMTCFMFHYFKNPEMDFPSKKIRFRDYESDKMEKLLACGRNLEERNKAVVGFERSLKIVLIKGFRDIEGEYIDYLTELVGKKIVPVGPLVQEPTPDEKGDEISDEILSWLDKKEEKSTVFVSFGSEYFLTKGELDEIAYGLEMSKLNFIWVVRFPKGGSNGLSNGLLLDKTLPRGFLDRIGERGMVLQGWAPQAKILEHPSVGGFVSHCGWNSVLESMNFGVPIIAVPMHLDQPINARLVEEVGVGVEVVRDETNRLRKERLAAVINEVVVGDGGGEFVRKRAAEMKENLRTKKDQEIDDVVEQLFAVMKEFQSSN